MNIPLKLAIIVFASSLSTFVMASNDQDTVDIQLVDYSGKPPFTRQIKSVPVSDVARLESLGESAIEYVEVRQVIMRGKPPYRRVTIRLPVYDVAQFEMLEEQEKPARQGSRPPFRRHR